MSNMKEEQRRQLKELTFANILNKDADFIDVPAGFPKNAADWEKRNRLKGAKFTYQSKYGGAPLELVAKYVNMAHSYGEKIEGSERETKGAIFQKVVDYLPGPVSITFHTAENNYYCINDITSYELPACPE